MGRGTPRDKFSPVDPQEMDARTAKQLASRLRALDRQLRVNAWPVAQGLAFIRVVGPTRRGHVDITLKTKRQFYDFAELLAEDAGVQV